MVTKSKKTGEKKGRIKVGKLKLNKETVKNLSATDQKQIKGALRRGGPTDCGAAAGTCAGSCPLFTDCLLSC